MSQQGLALLQQRLGLLNLLVAAARYGRHVGHRLLYPQGHSFDESSLEANRVHAFLRRVDQFLKGGFDFLNAMVDTKN